MPPHERQSCRFQACRFIAVLFAVPRATRLLGKLRHPSFLLAWVALSLYSTTATTTRAGIPEPDLIWYGQILNTSGQAPVRVTQGQLVWRIEPIAGGAAVVVRSDLADINGQFSFVVRVPCETPEPGAAPNAATLNLTTPPSSYRRITVTLDGQGLFFAGGATQFTLNPTDRGMIERIDLRSTAVPADADNDGIADTWEQQFFGAAGADPNADSDSDGLVNLREYRAGTNPLDPRSVLEFVEVAASEGQVSVRWSSQTGKRYRVRRAPNLSENAADYVQIQAGIAATPPVNSFTDTTVGTAPRFFYLIELE
jgi:hypothetical protein